MPDSLRGQKEYNPMGLELQPIVTAMWVFLSETESIYKSCLHLTADMSLFVAIHSYIIIFINA